jgi:putative ABC transport system substrate-binding protein
MTTARWLAVILLLALPLAAESQPRVQRIGYLTGGSPTAPTAIGVAGLLRQGLRDHGWVEGQHFVMETRFAEGRYERLPELAADLARLNVDVIVAGGTAASRAAKNATQTIPIVMVGSSDPARIGLVATLARPGGNVTGLAFGVGSETTSKGLELLKATIPKVRRVALLTNPDNPGAPLLIRDVQLTARSLGVQLHRYEARTPEEFDGVFSAMGKDQVGALLVVTEAAFILHRARLVELSVRHKLPSMYGFREDAEAGALMSYGASLGAMFRRAGFFVDKILKGARPGDLPVEQPSTFELVVNKRAARALGLTIPQPVLLRADHVIE